MSRSSIVPLRVKGSNQLEDLERFEYIKVHTLNRLSEKLYLILSSNTTNPMACSKMPIADVISYSLI